MMNLLLLAAGTYVAAVADTALAPALALYGIAPSFMVLAAIVGSIASAPSPWRVAQLGAVGLAFDLNSGSHFGAGVIGFAIVAFALGHWRAPLRRLGIAEQAVVTAAAAACLLLLVAAVNRLFGAALAPLRIVAPQALGAAVYTAAVSVPVWLAVAWFLDSRRRIPAMTRAGSISR